MFGKVPIKRIVAHVVLDECMSVASNYAQQAVTTDSTADSVSVVWCDVYRVNFVQPSYLHLCQSRCGLLAQGLQPSQCRLVTLNRVWYGIRVYASVSIVNLQNIRLWSTVPPEVKRAYARWSAADKCFLGLTSPYNALSSAAILLQAPF